MTFETLKRRENLILWLGVATAIAVAAVRLGGDSGAPAPDPGAAAGGFNLQHWFADLCILWSLTLFVLAWLHWRDARRRRDELEMIIASVTPDALLVVAPDRTIRMCNPSVKTLFGYEPGELLGRKTDLLYGDRRAAGREHEIADHIERHGVHLGPATGTRRDGARIPLEIMTARLRGQPGAVVLIRDITERTRVEQLRDSLTHMIVHDLRNPLFGIAGNLKLLGGTGGSRLSDDDRAAIGQTLDFANELEEMISSVLDVSRLEEGRLPVNPVRTDVAALADRAATMLQTLIREKRQTLTWTPAPAFAYGDPDLVERVIGNLLRNAVEATPSQGAITLTVATEGHRVRVAVADTGPGIPLEYRTVIFEKFGQVRDKRQTKKRSAGLGLTFCKLAAEAQGGRIGVESEAGRGSLFWFDLPTEAPVKPPAPEAKGTAP
jgi:PAS domain S-box-containing protein